MDRPLCQGVIVPFLEWMEKEGLVSRSSITKDDSGGFDARFRIQKCVFVAQYLGLDRTYRYNLYLHGPYSPSLSQDYYKAANGEVDDGGTNLDFDREAVLEIMGKGNDWLELATTLVDIMEEDKSVTDPAALVKRAAAVKYLYPEEDIERVLRDMRTTPLADVFGSLVWPTESS